MEASNVLLLLEKVLFRHSSEDSNSSSASFSTLHKSLLDSEDYILNLALKKIETLQQKHLIDKKTGKKFTKYIHSIKSENSSHTPKPIYTSSDYYFSSRETLKIGQLFTVLLSKRFVVLKSAFSLLKANICLRKAKQFKTEKFWAPNVKYFVFMNIQLKMEQIILNKSFTAWKYKNFLYPKIVLRKITEKANIRYFYSKFVTVINWKCKTWPGVKIISNLINEQQFLSIEESSLSLVENNEASEKKIEKLLSNLTNNSEFLSHFNLDQRKKALFSLIITKKRMQENLSKTVKFISRINKKRRQLPIRILYKWTSELIKRQESCFKVSLGVKQLFKVIARCKRSVLYNIRALVERSKNRERVLRFEKLKKNSLNFFYSKQKVLNCFKEKSLKHQMALKNIVNLWKKTPLKMFLYWKNNTMLFIRMVNAKKINKMMKVLASALKVTFTVPLKTCDSNKKTNRVLMRLMIHICKHLRQVLSISIQRMKNPRRTIVKYKNISKNFSVIYMKMMNRKGLMRYMNLWQNTILNHKIRESLINYQDLTFKHKKIFDACRRALNQNLKNCLGKVGNIKLAQYFFHLVRKKQTGYEKKIFGFVVKSLSQVVNDSVKLWKNKAEQLKFYSLNKELCYRKAKGMTEIYYKNFRMVMIKWANYIKNLKKVKICAFNFQNKLLRIADTASYRVKHILFSTLSTLQSKQKYSLISFTHTLQKSMHHNLTFWKSQIFSLNKSELQRQIKAFFLSKKLANIPQSIQKFTLSRLITKSNPQVKKNLKKVINKKLSSHLSIWQKSLITSKLAQYFSSFKAIKLSSTVAKFTMRHLSVFFHNWQRKVMREKFILNVQARSFTKVLDILIRSRHKMTFMSMVHWKNHLFKALKSLSLSYMGHARVFFLKWRSVIDNEKRKGAIFALKILKIKNALERIVKLTIREASSRLLQGAEKMRITMDGLVNSLKGIPQKAIRRWNKVIIEIKEREMFYKYNSQKILMILGKLTRRTYKESILKLLSAVEQPIKLRFALQSLEKVLKRVPRAYFEVWKNVSKDIRNHSIIIGYNSQICKTTLEKVLNRTLRQTIETLKRRRKTLKSFFSPVIEKYQKVLSLNFIYWKEKARSIHQSDLINSLKLKMTLSSLVSLCRKKFRDVFTRILTGGEKLKQSIQGLMSGLNNIPKAALKKWNKVVVEIKAFEVKLGFISSRLVTLATKICLRTLFEANKRIKNESSANLAIQKCLVILSKIYKKKPKQAFDCWKKLLYNLDKEFLLEQLKSTKLLLMLTKVSIRIIKDSFMRMLGGGNKFKGIFMIYVSTVIRRPKNALDEWKKYLALVKEKKLKDEIMKIKLTNFIKKLVGRTFKLTTSRIISKAQKVVKAVEKIVAGVKNLQLKGMLIWKRYLSMVKHMKLFDNFRSEKLKARLYSIIRKSWQRTINRLFSDKSTVSILKHLYLMLEATYFKGSKKSFSNWKEFVKDRTHFEKINKLRGLGMSKILRNLCSKTHKQVINALFDNHKILDTINGLTVFRHKKMKKEGFCALRQFFNISKKKSILEELATEKLRYSIVCASKRSLNCGFIKIIRGHDKSFNVMSFIVEKIKKKPRLFLKKWMKIAESLKNNEKLGSITGIFKLVNWIANAQNKQKFTGFSTIHQNYIGSLKKYMKIRDICKRFNAKLANFLKNWKQNTNSLKNFINFHNKRCKKLNKRLRSLCKKYTLRNCKMIFNANEAIKKLQHCFFNILKIFRKLKSNSLHNWREKVYSMHKKSLYASLQTQRMLQFLNTVHKKALKPAFFLIIKNKEKLKILMSAISNHLKNHIKVYLQSWKKNTEKISKKKMQDELKAFKLKELLTKILNTRMKSVTEKICINKDKMKLALNVVVENLLVRPKHVLKKWKNEVHYIREQALINFFKSEKLSQFAEKMVQKNRNQFFSRITGKKNKLFLLHLYMKLASNAKKRTQKLAMDSWSQQIKDEKYKNLKNLIRIEKLLKTLQIVRNNKLKKHFDKFLKIGQNVNGTMKKMLVAYNEKFKHAFDYWYKQTVLSKNKLVCRTLKSNKFCENLKKVLFKEMSFSYRKVVRNKMDKVKIALNALMGEIKSRKVYALANWRMSVTNHKQYIIMKGIQNEKFFTIINCVCLKRLKVPIERIKNLLPCFEILKSRFKVIEKIVKSIPKHSFELWKLLISDQKKKAILNNLNKEKIINLLGNTVRKAKKSSLNRILGEGNAARGALRTLYSIFSKLPRRPFSIWKHKNNQFKEFQMKQQLSLAKLKHVLANLISRQVKLSLAQVLKKNEQKTKTAKVLSNAYRVKARHVFNTLKSNVEKLKLFEQIQRIKGIQSQKFLIKLCKNQFLDIFKRLKNLVFVRNLNKVQFLILFNQFYELNRLASNYHDWRVKALKHNLNNKLQKYSGQLLRVSLKGLINSKKAKIILKLLNSEKVLKNLQRLASKFLFNTKATHLAKWCRLAHQKSANLNKLFQKALTILSKLPIISLNQSFSIISKPSFPKLKSIWCRMQLTINSRLSHSFFSLQENMRKKKTLRKAKGALNLITILSPKPLIMLKGRFNIWKNIEDLRLLRLMKNSIITWILHSSINYQNSFWKMKYVLAKRKKIYDPKFILCFRKLLKIGLNYQTRLKQYAHFKLLMVYKSAPEKKALMNRNYKRHSVHRALMFLNKNELSKVQRPATPEDIRKRDSLNDNLIEKILTLNDIDDD